jgi:hypothetical protein
MTTDAKNIANRTNSKRSTGPKTSTGKKYSSQNTVKHGFFSRNPALSDAEKEEFENLVGQLEKDKSPKTTLQHLAIRDIAWCMRRCNIALMLEARSAETLLEQTQKTENGVSETLAKPTGFYASSPLDLRAGLSWFKGVVGDFHAYHVMREEWRPTLELLFGPRFFQLLTEWNTMTRDAVLLAIMLEEKHRTFNMPHQQFDEFKKTSTHVIDPYGIEQLKEKLLDLQLQHMQEFLSTWQQRAEANSVANPRIADFPRYYTTATRDLHKAVEWHWRLKELEGAA